MKKFIKSKESLFKKLNEGHKIYSESWGEEEYLFLEGDITYDETLQVVCPLQDLDLDLENNNFYIKESLSLKRIDWYYSGTADYIISKKGNNFFISIDDLEEIPFEEIESLVKTVKDLK